MDFIRFSCFLFIVLFIFQASADCQKKPIWNVTQEANLITTWLLENAKKCKDSEIEYPGFDGWYHNLDKIDLGSAGHTLFKGWAGIKANASKTQDWLEAWRKVMANISMCRDSNNALALLFGKQVADEILNIGNPSCAERYDLNHHHHHHRAERNYATPYIDGEVIYGTSRYWAGKHISRKNGTVSTEGIFVRNVDVTSLLQMCWIKWHNALAEELYKTCSKWSAKRIFNEARKFTIAVQQRIYVYEWLPAYTGKSLAKYNRYDPLVDPQVEKLFQAAMHLPQSGPEWFCGTLQCKQLKNASGTGNHSRDVIKYLLQELNFLPCKARERNELVKNMEQYFGLPDINHASKAFKLSPYSTWTSFLESNHINASLLQFYSPKYNLQQLDSMLGGILESSNGPGKLFVEVILDQFRRVRDGDRFWFENSQNNLFSEEEICRINNISLADVLATVMGFTPNQNRFQWNPENVLPLLFYINLKMDQGSSNKGSLSPNQFIRNAVMLSIMVLTYCLGLVVIGVCLIAGRRSAIKATTRKENQTIKQSFKDKWQIQYPTFLVLECDETQGPKKRMLLVLDKHKKQILVYSTTGTIIRAILCQAKFQILTIRNKAMAILKASSNYDLVVKFESKSILASFINDLDLFMTQAIKIEKPTVTKNVKWKVAKQGLITKQHYQTLLEMFFRVAFAQAFKIEHSIEEMLGVDTSIATEVIYTKLTLGEFAQCLRMCPESEFVNNIFSLVDRDQRGFICFREFLDFIILFASGKEEQRLHLFFKLYDIDGTDVLPAKHFKAMLNSFLDIAVERSTLNHAQDLLRQYGVDHKDKLDYRDFKKVIGHKLENLSPAILDSCRSVQNDRSYLSMARQTILNMCRRHDSASQEPIIAATDKEQKIITKSPEKIANLQKSLICCENYSKQWFWFAFITLAIVFIFVDKAYYFYSISKAIGINKWMLAVSKAASYGIVLTYSVMVLTRCRNISIAMENTFLNRYVPFSKLQIIHCYMSYLSAVFTLIHVVGKTHLLLWFVDFVSTTTCETEFVDEEIEYIIELKWKNPVTLSGLLLVPFILFVWVFAQPCMRSCYNIFYCAHHQLHPLLIILIVLHGALSQRPLLCYILLGLLIIFLFDSLIGITRRKITLPVLRIEFLPSNVICLILKRPANFQYNVGQWVRLDIDQINPKMFHRFALSSTPSDTQLRIHILPNHPFAHQLCALTEPPDAQIQVYLDGAYGNGLQHWRLHDVTVLIGAGTSVALLASVLMDIAHVLRTKTDVPCKKVYFIWISKTQKYCEWVTDLIREAEDFDDKGFFRCHLFVTEFYEKFDLRTIMLMIFEKHYERVFGRSILTGLKSAVHFGRPDFAQLFRTIQSLHDKVATVGVFTAGPRSLRRSVSASCTQMNLQGNQRFEHCCVNQD